MTNPIVKVAVSIQVAPAPSALQKTGAFISAGGTITSPGTKSLLTQLSDLTPLLATPQAISSIGWSGGTATVIAAANHGYPVGQTVNVTIAGAVPSGFNGTFPCSVISPTTFTYPLASNPGTETTPGTYVNADAQSLVERATTFFGQGAAQSVYVLEVGPSDASHGVAFLSVWITANPNFFYSYLPPRFWDGNSALITMLQGFEGTAAKTYFFVTTTLQNYALYAGMKCVLWMIEAPVYGIWPANVLTGLSWNAGVGSAVTTTNHGVVPGQWFQLSGNTPAGWNGWFLAQAGTTGDTLVFNVATNPGAETALGTLVASQYASAGIGANEFSLAAVFRVTLNYAPSSTNKVTPLYNAFVFGVTSFPTQANAALITTLLAAGGNLIGTGAAGGFSDTVVLGGQLGDENPFKYWYSIDWVQINLALALNAVLINGANNPANPVDYDQFGINVLQQAAVATMSTGIADALVLNPIAQTGLSAEQLQTAIDLDTYGQYTLVNADPFTSYTIENPNDYQAGIYNGISVDYTPLRGFESIQVNVTVSNFAS